MKEAIVHPLPNLTTEIHEIPIPIPEHDQLVIKVVVAGSNVKDWDHITTRKISANSGDDIAGTVYALGKDVEATGEFHVGDRVAAFHPMLTPGGAYAEYAVAPQHTTFKLPNKTTFEKAATIPLVAMTAGIAMYRCQALPVPWSPRTSTAPPLPFIIYGASSSLGCFAIKLARVSNIHPIIAIAGSTVDYLRTLLDPNKGDTIVDYRQGPEAMKAAVKAALGSLEATHALDAISAHGTWVPLAQMVSPTKGQVSVVSGANAYNETKIPEGVEIKYVYVGTAHYGSYLKNMPKQPADKEAVESTVEFAYVFYRYIARLLARGDFEGHPYTVIPGGLGGVGKGLNTLKEGLAKGKKFIYRIAETEGLSSK